MTEQEIFEKVKAVIADKLQVEPEKVTLEARFIEDLGADSLDTVELIMGLEDEFGLEISDEEAEKIRTVKDAVEYIKAKLGQGPPRWPKPAWGPGKGLQRGWGVKGAPPLLFPGVFPGILRPCDAWWSPAWAASRRSEARSTPSGRI